LDYRDLKYELIPFAESGVKIVIGNTMVKRGLVDSKYNEPRKDIRVFSLFKNMAKENAFTDPQRTESTL